jgi:arginyl-tRNA--protein-N-Asp/Glu arginylyltransferase
MPFTEANLNANMAKLTKGELLAQTRGVKWRMHLRALLEAKKITQGQFNEYVTKEQAATKTGKAALQTDTRRAEKAATKVECDDCGEIIGQGTYGVIFQSNKSADRVIKASKKGHSITTGCPEEYAHEVKMFDKIRAVFPRLETVSMPNKYRAWFDNGRHCFYEMDKIHPLHIDEPITVKINKKIREYEELSASAAEKLVLLQEDLDKLRAENAKKYLIIEAQEEINEQTNKIRELKDTIDAFVELRDGSGSGGAAAPIRKLILLRPGNPEDKGAMYATGGSEGSWIEIGEKIMTHYFEIFGIHKKTYYDDLTKILTATLCNNIIITDVEFVLGSIRSGDSLKNGIFMIDFDKTSHSDDDINSGKTNAMLQDDVFPGRVKILIETRLKSNTLCKDYAANAAASLERNAMHLIAKGHLSSPGSGSRSPVAKAAPSRARSKSPTKCHCPPAKKATGACDCPRKGGRRTRSIRKHGKGRRSSVKTRKSRR